MAKRGLTGNEKRVLFGLVHRPTLNDRELSELLGVKVSTVTAIRRRLRRAEYFATKRIPMMHRLGWEILAAGHARVDLAQSPQAVSRLREVLRDRIPGLFHLIASADHVTFLSAAPNYTAFRRDLDDFRQLLERAKVLGDGDVSAVLFPAGLSVIPGYFDYSHALALGFGMEDRITFKPDFARPEPADLTHKETEVLKGLVRFPELSDKALAQRVKVSRQAVSKMRRAFEADGILRTVRLPNLRALGFELFATAFAHFNPASGVRARAEAIERTLRAGPVFFYAASDDDSVLLAGARNYEQFTTLRHSIVKYAQERGYLRGEPTVYLGLTNNTEIIRHCEFSPLVGTLTDPVPS